MVDLDDPLAETPSLLGAPVVSVSSDSRRLVFAMESATVGQVVTALSGAAALRDISIIEPDIEEVVARLYAAGTS